MPDPSLQLRMTKCPTSCYSSIRSAGAGREIRVFVKSFVDGLFSLFEGQELPQVGRDDRGVVPECGSWSGLDDGAALHDVGPIGDRERLARVLFDQQDRC